MQTGDKISFGNYQWRVLEILEDRALIITEYIIERRPYHNVYKETTWADSAIRAYLNGEFYDRFSVDDQSRMIPVLNKNPDNEWYGCEGGDETWDTIFLLSMEESACRYFGDSSLKLYNPGRNQRYWFERKDKNNSKRIARREGEKGSDWWWLRSPGRVGVKAVYIHGDGNIGIQGNNILIGNLSDGQCRGGVRPALWLKL